MSQTSDGTFAPRARGCLSGPEASPSPGGCMAVLEVGLMDTPRLWRALWRHEGMVEEYLRHGHVPLREAEQALTIMRQIMRELESRGDQLRLI